MRAALARLEKLEARAEAAPPSPARRRLDHARRLYEGHPAALRRLLAAPHDAAAVLEYRLDLRLARVARHALARDEPDSLRRVELDPCADAGPAAADGGLMIPLVDDRFFDPVPGDDGHVVIPTEREREPLLVWGERPPETPEECYWLAGTAGDGLYVAVIAGDVEAIRSRGGRVEVRRFGEAWNHVGTV